MVALGPGVLTIGGTAGAGTDYSCLVNGMSLGTDVSVDSSTFKLCGTEVPGKMTPTGTLSGNVDQDIDAATGGLFQYCSEHWGEVADFTFEPSTSAGLEAAGKLLVVPLTFGGDTYGDPLVSDVSFTTVGDIAYTRGGTGGWTQTMSPKQAPTTSATAATGATAGTPGGFTPAGATTPANLAALSGVTASPTTAWTTGQYVALGDASHAHWSGTAWVTGPALLAADAEF
jgi:hypothetical protein